MESRRKENTTIVSALWVVVTIFLLSAKEGFAFSPPCPRTRANRQKLLTVSSFPATSRNDATTRRYLSDNNNNNNNNNSNNNNASTDEQPEIKFSRPKIDNLTNLDEQNKSQQDDDTAALTSTVNERLMAELKVAENKEKYGARSSVGKKMGLVDGYGRPRKTDEEIQASIEKARDLNGVNPVVAVVGALFALGVAALLWYATGQLGTFFALHPVDTDVYFVQRSAQVVRNIAMGLISLASGFFGVTGLGILGMGIRVSYGVMTGELDPTPIKQNQADKIDMPNVWDLMTNKKPGRRGGKKSDNDNNPFGI